MLPTYSEINKRLLTHFLECKTFCGYIVLTLNQEEVQSIFPKWSLAEIVDCTLKYWEDIAHQRPVDAEQVFGIIAVQSMAAYEHSLSGHKAVRKSIKHLLKIDTNALSKLFKGGKKRKDQTFQDKLWYGAKAYLWETHHLEMDLPPPRKGFAHRFVQYPASQVLFTEKELKCFSRIFAEEQLLPESQISEERFRRKVFDNWKSYESYLPQSVKNRLEDQPKKHWLLGKQIYQYFCDWDGTVYHLQYGRVRRTDELSASQKLVAEFIDGQYHFSWYDPGTMIYSKADLSVFFEEISKSYEVLQLEADYNNVYTQQSGSIQSESPFLLIFKMDLNKDARRYFQYKEILNEKKTACYQLTKGIYACRFEDLKELESYSFLQVEAHSSTPVQLVYGLKVGFKTYLKGCGPSILQREKSVALTLIKIGYGTIPLSSYDPDEAGPGKYLLIIPGYPRISFHIQDLAPHEPIISPSIGMKYDSWRLNIDEYDVAGCLFTKEVTQTKQLLREWIQVQIQADYKSTGTALIIQALNRSKYGKSSG